MSRGVIIVGAAGHGRGVLEILVAAADLHGGECTVRGFLDDDARRSSGEVAGLPILGGISMAAELAQDHRFVIGIGDPERRADVARRLQRDGGRFESAIHPTATLYREVQIAAGSVIAAGVVVAASSRLDDHVLLNLNATVGHDCTLGPFATVGPGGNIGGHVQMGERAFVGLNGSVLPGLSLGAGSTLGAGSVLLQDLEAGVTAFGVPARVVHRGRPGT